MANKFDQFGLKEVANVTFYEVGSNKPVLFLDTLKVSNIETTAEDVSAQGGWGNPKLITWEYGKEVNLTLEDALFSPESLHVMMGAENREAKGEEVVKTNINDKILVGVDGTIKKFHDMSKDIDATKNTSIKGLKLDTNNRGTVNVLDNGEYVEKVIAVTTEGSGPNITYKYQLGKVTGEGFVADTLAEQKEIRIFYIAELKEEHKGYEITISADKFGGNYKIVGDTLVRNKETLKDEAFQFVIEKAKINADVTFEMSADGDPATFSMPITVMRADDGTMFKLIKYSFED